MSTAPDAITQGEREAAELEAKAAMEARFATRLASDDQRNGYEVGYYEALLAHHRLAAHGAGEGLREAVADAIAKADESFGYSFNLTRLVDGEETHTLSMKGFEPIEFEDRDDGYRLIAQRRNAARSDAVLAALARDSDTQPKSGERALRAVLAASLAKRSVGDMDPPWTGAFNSALDMVSRDTGVLASIAKVSEQPCTLGVGCDDYGVCYATAHGDPGQCPKALTPPTDAGSTTREGGEGDKAALLMEALNNPEPVKIGEGEYAYAKIEQLPAMLRDMVGDGLFFQCEPHVTIDAWNIARMAADELEARLAASPASLSGGAEEVARRFHDTYERLAPAYGYETRADTKVFDPTSANGRLMIAVCAEIAHPSPEAPASRQGAGE